MDRTEMDRLRERFDEAVHQRFPDAPIERVVLLQYGDEPSVEPGELLGRIYLNAPPERGERERVLHDFHDRYRDGIRDLQQDLDELPQAATLTFVVSTDGDGEERGPLIKLRRRRGEMDSGALVPVMARLGSVELETVDTLITAGIAPNRAEAIRWALARIRERPAYEELRARAREIEELKQQF
jgi:hypothetical protein